jgi:hypothetical protein
MYSDSEEDLDIGYWTFESCVYSFCVRYMLVCPAQYADVYKLVRTACVEEARCFFLYIDIRNQVYTACIEEGRYFLLYFDVCNVVCTSCIEGVW